MIKDRPITPLLVKQMKVQSERLKQCGLSAKMNFISQVLTTGRFAVSDEFKNTIYSKRLKR